MNVIEDKTILVDVYKTSVVGPGLCYGTTGLGIALWLCHNLSDDEFFRKSISELRQISSNVTIEKGITGVGAVLNLLYLKKRNVQLQGILDEIDAKVYQTTAYGIEIDTNSQYGAVLYLCHRLKYDREMSFDLRCVFEHLVNLLTEQIVQEFVCQKDNDYRFSLTHTPSIFVCLLSSVLLCIGDKAIWLKKIQQILPVLLDVFPYSAGNRLLYWLALSRLHHIIGYDKGVTSHLSLLKQTVSCQNLLDCVNGNIYLGEGACGIYCISRLFPKFEDDIYEFSHEVEQFITRSSEKRHLQDLNYLKTHIGLWNGVAGIELTDLLMKIDRFKYGKAKK